MHSAGKVARFGSHQTITWTQLRMCPIVQRCTFRLIRRTYFGRLRLTSSLTWLPVNCMRTFRPPLANAAAQ